MTKKQYLIVGALLVVAFSVGRFSSPKRIEERSSDKTTTNETKNVDKNQNVVETSKETRLPDGTIVIEKRKEKETSTQTESERRSESEKITSKITENRPSFSVGVLYEPAIAGFQKDNYSVMVQKRIVSELYAGVSYSSRNTVGLVLSLGF